MKCSTTKHQLLRPLRKLTSTLAESIRYSTQQAPGVTVFNQKSKKRPRLPRSWSGWNSNATAWACRLLPIACTEKSRAQLSAVAITRSFPTQLKRRGVELRLIVGDHNRSAVTLDLPLLKAVARAHRWFDEISTGKANCLAEIVAHEELAVRYVGRLIRLAFLAPDIVESIMEGRQPASVTAEALTPVH